MPRIILALLALALFGSASAAAQPIAPPTLTVYALGPLADVWAIRIKHSGAATIQARCTPPGGPERLVYVWYTNNSPERAAVVLSARPCPEGSAYTFVLTPWDASGPDGLYGLPTTFGPYREGQRAAYDVFLPLLRSAP